LFCVALTFLVPVAQSSAQSLDSSFVPELTSDVVINSMAVQPDGKVIVAFGLGPHFLNAETNFIRANEVSLVRLDANGSLDPTFARVPHASTPFRRSASAVVLLTDGSAIVAGDFFVPGTFWHTGMVKVSSNGVVEQSYHGAVGNGQIRDMLLQPDGKLLVCGFNQVASGSTNVGIVRLQPDGTVDPSFGSSISHENDLVRIDTICLQPDGKLVIGGSFTHVDSIYLPHLARLNANGSLDGSFQPMLQEPADVEHRQLGAGLYLSASPVLLRRALMARPLAKRTVVLAGYAGWGPGQLDQELEQSSWLIMPVELDLIFEIPAAASWETAIRRLGADPHLLHMGQGVH